MVDLQPAAESTAPLTPTARQLLVDWANAQDGWMRRLVLEVLASGKAASAEVIEDVYEHFLAEKQLVEDSAPAVPPLKFKEEVDVGSSEFLFRRLEAVRGVNALAENQQIEFNAGLTILYGENGAGKTGYARILKRLADVRTAEPILPNVHDPATTTAPEATITFSVGGVEQTLQWNGEAGVAPMTHVSVFDSPAVRLHVDDDLAYVYTPRDLALFKAVSEGIDAVKVKAEAGVSSRRPRANPYLAHFSRGTPVYSVVETLGPATDVPALRVLATVTEAEETSAELLRATVSALQSDSIPAQLTAARGREELYRELTGAATKVASFDVEAHNQAVATATEAAQSYANTRSELLASVGISADSEEAWQEFVLRGEVYRDHLEADHYPNEGDHCLYCRQPLQADAAALLSRYREFATDASRQRVDDARTLAKTLARGLSGLDRPALSATVERHREDDREDAVLVQASSLLIRLDEQAANWETGHAVDWSGLANVAKELERESTARHEAAKSLIADLTTKSTDRATRLQEDSATLATLESRLELRKRLPEIETHVADAKWAQLLEQLVRKFPPVLRSLTEVAKTASEQLLNADFERRFAEECSLLRAPSVRLEFPGKRGQSARRKVISTDHRPSQVLAEGEQKVIALADFLAEAALRLIPAPVIFDDPVTSLDYRRIREVADRVAGLAKDRQVIVFTHNIWFATELLARFEKSKDRCSYFSVTDEGGKGIVVRGTHPRWDNVKSITGKINDLIQSAKASEGDAREAIVEKTYSWIRSWCEVVVEQELLKGVTQRYQANVMMTLLPQIRGDRLQAATGVIGPIFERACRIMEGHSQPLETLSIRPTLEELEKDWAELRAALDTYSA